MSGCNPRTRLIPVEAPLAEGTEIWIPTDAKEEPQEGPDKDGSEGEPEEESSTDRSEEEQTSWRGRLRTRARSRKALKVQYEPESRNLATGQERSTEAEPLRPWEGYSEDAQWCFRQTRGFTTMLERGPEKGLLRKVQSKLLRCEGSRRTKIRSREGREPTHQQVRDSPLMVRIRENIAKSSVYCNRKRVLRWILDCGVDPNATSRDGNTLLHMAAYYGRSDMCYTLLKRGASTDRLNRHGETASASAEKGGSVACQKMLEAWPNLTPYLAEGLGAQGEHAKAGAKGPANAFPGEKGVSLDTAPLLQGVIDKVKTAAALQVHQGYPRREIPSKVAELCDKAHEEYARAYMLERMLLVESLKGIAARDIHTNAQELQRSGQLRVC